MIGLVSARVAAGYTLKTAGLLIGKTDSHLSKIERGLVALTTLDALILAQAYGVSISDIVQPAAYDVPYLASEAVAVARALGVSVEEILRKVTY